ncbi:hypothetical protein [Nocardioides pelophilus]|uniref:hypothetical protein n=1 Tax=Nocardioides pelophilus TaxID=2172019 RepID=UPI001601A522|nr:hypothetical protein [Nocardioides pelophilus]
MVGLRNHSVEALRAPILVQILQRLENGIGFVVASGHLDHDQSVGQPDVVPADRPAVIKQVVPAPEEVDELLEVLALIGVVANERYSWLEQVGRVRVLLGSARTVVTRNRHVVTPLAEATADDSDLHAQQLRRELVRVRADDRRLDRWPREAPPNLREDVTKGEARS